MSEAAAAPPEAAPEAAPRRPTVATWKLAAVLAGGGAVAGLLLVVSYLLTLEPIQKHKAQVLADGIREVLGLVDADTIETLYWVDGRFTTKRPVDDTGVERAYRGRRADGTPAGWAVVAEGQGFADAIRLIFGYDAKTKRILAMKVLENKETPGLGDTIGKDPSFAARFRGRTAPVKGVKVGQGTGAPNEVDTITGATVSSRSVVRIINTAVATWSPRIEGWREEVGR